MFANQEPPLVKMIALGPGAQLSRRALSGMCRPWFILGPHTASHENNLRTIFLEKQPILRI